MRAAIYIRVSTEEQVQEGLSLHVQERRCRERAEADGAAEVRLYRDDGFTGTNTRRPGLQQLLTELDDTDAIYCWDLDRLFRDDIAQAVFLADLAERGDIDLVEISGGGVVDFRSSTGWFVTRLRGLIAQLKPMQTAERVTASLRYRVEVQGLHHGAPPLGYEASAPGEPMQAVEHEAAIVRRCFELYDEGLSLQKIVESANVAGWPERVGNVRWSHARVRYLLRNPLYAGYVLFAGEKHEGRHKPIVPRPLWERVQQRLDRRAAGAARPNATTYASLFRCGLCGGYAYSRRDTQRGYGRYGCASRSLVPVADRHRPVSVSMTMADAIVEQWTRHLVSADAMQQAVELVAAELAEDKGTELRDLDEQLARLDREISYYHRAGARGSMPEEMVEAEVAPLLREREQAKRARGKLLAGPARIPPWLEQYAERGADELFAQPRPVVMEFLLDLYERIDLFGDYIVIHHRLAKEPVTVEVPRYRRDPDQAAREALGLS